MQNESHETDSQPSDATLSRRSFLLGARGWSAVVAGLALGLGASPEEARAGAAWVNRRGGYGGTAGWINGHGGGWVNGRVGGVGGWINGGGGSGWVNRRGGGGWINGRW